MERMARDVPADGNPSRRTGQTFTCRVWIGDVVAELGRKGVLDLKKSIGESLELLDGEGSIINQNADCSLRLAEIELDAIFYAKEVEMDVVAKRWKALIVTDTGASSS